MAKQTFTTGQVLTAAQVNSLQTNDFNQTVNAKTASYVLVASDKGTRIEFNTSGSVTCTVNTGLFDAGDTLIVQNRGTGAVTITAGTATVNTGGSLVVNQYESGTLYFISASAALWFGSNPGDITGITTGATSGLTGGVTSGTADLKLNTTAKGDLLVGTGAAAVTALTVGANNTILTADSSTASGLKWAAASAGALTLISTTSSSAVATSVTYSNCFSSTYRNYLVLMDGSQTTNSGEIAIQMRSSGTTQVINYYAGRITYGTGGTVTASAQVNTSQFQVCPGSSNKFTMAAWIMNPQVGKVQFHSTFFSRNGDAGGSTVGFVDATTSYDSMVISWSGNYTGTVSIYGYGI